MTIAKSTLVLSVVLLLTSCCIHTESKFKKSKLSNFTYDQTVEILEESTAEDISQLNVKVAGLNTKLTSFESSSESEHTSNCCKKLEDQIGTHSKLSATKNFEAVNSTIVFFDINKYKLSLSDKQDLLLFKTKIDMANEFCSDYQIKIYPYTDSTGNNEYNSKLRKLRGESIKMCFVEEFGVDEDRLSIITNNYNHLSSDYYNRRALIKVTCL